MKKIINLIIPVIIFLIGLLLAICYKEQQLQNLDSDILNYGINNIKTSILVFIIIYIISIKISLINIKNINFNLLILILLILNHFLIKINFNEIIKIVILLISIKYIVRLKNNIFYLLFILLFNLIVFQSISPIYSGSIFSNLSGRLDAIQPLINTFINNSIFGELYNSFNQKTSFGGEVYYPLSQSELLQIYLTLNYSNANTILEIFNGFKNYIFILYTVSMYGVYFLIIKEFSYSKLSSMLAGLLYIYGNPAFIGYLGNENYHHLSEYIVFPFAILYAMRGIRLNNNTYYYISGFILGASTLIMRSAIEFRVIAVLFFIITISIIYYFKFEKNNISKFIKLVIIIVFGYACGSIIDIVSILGNIYSGNLSAIQPHQFYGYPWKTKLVEWWSIFFQYEPVSIYPSAPDDVGKHVGFYRGPILTFIFVYFIYCLKKSNAIENQYCVDKKKIVLYLIINILLILNIQFGHDSLISMLMEKIEFGRIHFSSRYICFYNIIYIFPILFFFEKCIYLNQIRKKEILKSAYTYVFIVLILYVIKIPITKTDLQVFIVVIFVICCIKNYKYIAFSVIIFSSLTCNSEIESLIKLNKLDDKYDISNFIQNNIISENLNEKCANEINGIDRFTINPICQYKNNEINSILGNNYERHLYLYKKQLPQFIPSSKNLDVADGAIYTYAGSPITPNKTSTEILKSIFSDFNRGNSIKYNFEIDNFNDKNFRNALDLYGIKYFVIENDLINNNISNTLNNFYFLIYSNKDHSIYLNKNSKKIFRLYEYKDFNDISNKEIISFKDNSKNLIINYELLSNFNIIDMLGSISKFYVYCPIKCIFIIDNVYLSGYSAFSKLNHFDVKEMNNGRIAIIFNDYFNGEIFLEFNDFYRNISGIIFLLNLLFILYLKKINHQKS